MPLSPALVCGVGTTHYNTENNLTSSVPLHFNLILCSMERGWWPRVGESYSEELWCNGTGFNCPTSNSAWSTRLHDSLFDLPVFLHYLQWTNYFLSPAVLVLLGMRRSIYVPKQRHWTSLNARKFCKLCDDSSPPFRAHCTFFNDINGALSSCYTCGVAMFAKENWSRQAREAEMRAF